MVPFNLLAAVTWICALLGTTCATRTQPDLEVRGLLQRGVNAALNRLVDLFADGRSSSPCKCGVSKEPEEMPASDGEQRVVGGVRSRRYEFPWHVGVVSTLGILPFCGGSLISDRFVLTAGHCVDGRRAAMTQVTIRSHVPLHPMTLRMPVARIVVHPQFDANTYGHDVALLELLMDLPLERFAGAVAPICLPQLGGPPQTGNGTAAGWGALFIGSPPAAVLRKVTLPLVPVDKCNATVSGRLDSSMICAGGRRFSGTCYGDSGGSLMTRNSDGRYQVTGVTSWARVCTLLGHPTVFADVAGVTPWIQYTTAGSRYCGA